MKNLTIRTTFALAVLPGFVSGARAQFVTEGATPPTEARLSRPLSRPELSAIDIDAKILDEVRAKQEREANKLVNRIEFDVLEKKDSESG